MKIITFLLQRKKTTKVDRLMQPTERKDNLPDTVVEEGKDSTEYLFPDAVPKLAEEYGRTMTDMLNADTVDEYTGYLISRYANNLLQVGKADLQNQQKLNQQEIHLHCLLCQSKLEEYQMKLGRIDERLAHVQEQLLQMEKEEENDYRK